MCKKTVVLFATFLVFAAGTVLSGPQDLPEVLTVKKTIKNIQEAFTRMKTMRAGFRITIEKGKHTESMKGVLRFKSPDRIIFQFDNPKDQIIYCDASVLKIYLPELRVIGEQKLDTQNPDLLFINSRTSFYQLTKQYNFFFPEKNIRVINGQKLVILHLKQKNVYSGFKTLDLYVSDGWVILKAIGKTRDDKIITASFFDVEVNKPVSDNEFEFDVPVDIQTIRNPFYSPADKK